MKAVNVDFGGFRASVCVDDNVFKAIYSLARKEAIQGLVSEAEKHSEMMFGQDYIDLRDLRILAENM